MTEHTTTYTISKIQTFSLHLKRSLPLLLVQSDSDKFCKLPIHSLIYYRIKARHSQGSFWICRGHTLAEMLKLAHADIVSKLVKICEVKVILSCNNSYFEQVGVMVVIHLH